MKTLNIRYNKNQMVCNNVEEAAAFINTFGHLTSAGRTRLHRLFDDNATEFDGKPYAWMNSKHVPEVTDKIWVNEISK